jgi:transposase
MAKVSMGAAGPLPGRVSRSDVPRGAILSNSSKIGCAPQTLNEWVKKVEVDTGQRGGVTTEMAEKMKALERENRELKQANEILRKASAYFAPPLGDASIACWVKGRSSTAHSNDDSVYRRSPHRSLGRANLPRSADCPCDVL